MRTTYVAPLTSDTPKEPVRKPAPSGDGARPARTDTLLIGLDLGTNRTCLKAAYPNAPELLVDESLPTLVGYAKDGIVENLLPGNAKTLFGEQAARHRLYLRIVPPLADGVISDMAAAQDFFRHLRQRLNTPAGTELRAVIGLPATADRAARESLTEASRGYFHRVIVIPEPFLTALGFRDESRLADPSYLDPVRNSIFIDIGAGTTDVCLVQGYYPTPDDQISVPFAGDKVDQLLLEAIRRTHPDVQLSIVKVREIKEAHSYVGKTEIPASVTVIVGGKARKLDLGEPVGTACQQLLQTVFDCVKAIIAQASSDSVAEVLQNIILTGGGSRIRHLDTELQRLLTEEGYEKPRVLTVGENYKDYVARGALVAARQARENQWISLID